jgi:transglutaminase-like putative cysteine protease
LPRCGRRWSGTLLWRDDPPATPATIVAIVAAALVAVGSLARIFATPHYLAYALPALAIGAGVAYVYGRRSLGAAFVGVAFVWIVSLSPLFAPRDKYHGLPTAGALHIVRSLFSAGLTRAPDESLPVAPSARYMILVWTALLFLGFLGASWVIVRRPVGAVVTALGVVAFAGGLGAGRGRDGVAVAAVASIAAFFLAEGRHRIERWGSSRAPLWFGVPTLAAACAFAAFAPTLFGDGPLLNINSALRPRLIIIKPLSDVRRQLKVDPPIEVMRVVAPRPTYWRLTSLDTYDGTEWLLRARPQGVINGRVPRPHPSPTGEEITQRYRLTSLLAPWLPAAYAATSIDSTAGVDVDTSSQTLLLHGGTRPGLTYVVRSTIPRVTQDLQAPLHPSGDPIERMFGGIARPWVAGARTPLDIARRLESHFRAYTYDENVPGGHSVARLKAFLSAKRGYCEQFAATMTLMLRGLGVTARVGVGFLPGGFEGDGTYVVTTREAHAWVEADIPGAGWTTFDPTPGRGSSASVPPSVREQRPQPAPPVPRQTSLPAPTPSTQHLPDNVTLPHHTSIPVRKILVGLLAALAVGAIPGAKAIRRRRRRSAIDPRRRVLGAFAEFVDTAADLGWSSRAAETPREFCTRVPTGNGSDTAVLMDTSLRALYARESPTRDDGHAAWQASAAVTATLRRRTPAWRRSAALFDPRTLL